VGSNVEDRRKFAVLGISPGVVLQCRGDLGSFEILSVTRETGPLTVKDRPTQLHHRRRDRASVRLSGALLMQRERAGTGEHHHRDGQQESSHSSA